MPNVLDGIPIWQRLLLPQISKADGIPLWQMLWPHSCVGKCGRWNATVVHVVASIFLDRCFVVYGWCYAMSGRWNGHCIRVLFQFELWGVKQNLIPYMWQMALTNVLVKGWIFTLMYMDPFIVLVRF